MVQMWQLLVIGGSLRGAGDTRWAMIITVTIHWLMAIGSIILVRIIKTEPIFVWLFFIGFILMIGVGLFLRFQSGHWKKIKVIEDVV